MIGASSGSSTRDHQRLWPYDRSPRVGAPRRPPPARLDTTPREAAAGAIGCIRPLSGSRRTTVAAPELQPYGLGVNQPSSDRRSNATVYARLGDLLRPAAPRADRRQGGWLGAEPGKARYDGIADWYDKLFAAYGDMRDPLSSSAHLARLLGPGEGNCLDVACGGGLHHDAIVSIGRSVIGLDLSEDQLRVARRCGVARLLLRANATALPFPDATFPAVVCTYLHTDIDDMAPVFAEILRVLRPGGTLVYLGVHPCFWGHFIENPLGTGRIVHPGYLETGWIDSPYWRESTGLRA